MVLRCVWPEVSDTVVGPKGFDFHRAMVVCSAALVHLVEFAQIKVAVGNVVDPAPFGS